MHRSVERQRCILDFALSSLLRRRARNLSLLVLYTLIVFAVASLIFFVQALKREAAATLAGAPDMVVQRLAAGRHDLIPVGYAEKIRGIRGVTAVTPRRWGYYFDPVSGANYTLMAASGPPVGPGKIIAGRSAAGSQRVREGDLIALITSSGLPLPLTVERILPYESELVAADLLLLSEDDFQDMFGLPADRATDLAVTAGNPRELATIAAKVLEAFPDTRPILKSDMLRTYDSLFDWRGGILIVVLAAAVFCFVIFAWDKSAGLSAEERREIGILKSIGWDTADILLLKFWEGIVISLTAFLAGVLAAYVHIFFLSAGLFAPALKGWSVLYPDFRLVPVIDIHGLTVLFFLSVLPYTAATIIPSWLAATMDPDAAMRS